MAGIRPISPPVPFGTKSILVEATRSPDEAVQMSLQPGDTVWIGVRRIHARTNPGISVLIVSDCSPSTQYAIDLGGFIARLAHARVTLLHCESKEPATPAELQSFRKQLTGGPSALEVISSQDKAETAIANIVEQRPSDVIVLGFDVNEHLQRVEQILQHGEQHLLLAPAPSLKPSRVLICVACGEPGKEDVLFAGRLTHHLGADATLMTVLPEAARADERCADQIHRAPFGIGGRQLDFDLLADRDAVVADHACDLFDEVGFDVQVLTPAWDSDGNRCWTHGGAVGFLRREAQPLESVERLVGVDFDSQELVQTRETERDLARLEDQGKMLVQIRGLSGVSPEHLVMECFDEQERSVKFPELTP
jgi:hypothetical protein